MADHKHPDYELEDTLPLKAANQYKALFDETRLQVVDLLLERAATIKELSDALSRPKGTIGHHVSVLEEAGLIHVVRTKMVRAIQAKYYGRTARTFVLDQEASIPPDHFFAAAASEYTAAIDGSIDVDATLSTLRYARIPAERAIEWKQRLIDLTLEFSSEERGGATTYGLLVGLYPTDRPGFGGGAGE